MNQTEIEIIVNGRSKRWITPKINCTQLVILAFGIYRDDESIVHYTITYSTGNNQGGSLTNNQEIDVKDGMVFNVIATDKS